MGRKTGSWTTEKEPAQLHVATPTSVLCVWGALQDAAKMAWKPQPERYTRKETSTHDDRAHRKGCPAAMSSPTAKYGVYIPSSNRATRLLGECVEQKTQDEPGAPGNARKYGSAQKAHDTECQGLPWAELEPMWAAKYIIQYLMTTQRIK